MLKLYKFINVTHSNFNMVYIVFRQIFCTLYLYFCSWVANVVVVIYCTAVRIVCAIFGIAMVRYFTESFNTTWAFLRFHNFLIFNYLIYNEFLFTFNFYFSQTIIFFLFVWSWNLFGFRSRRNRFGHCVNSSYLSSNPVLSRNVGRRAVPGRGRSPPKGAKPPSSQSSTYWRVSCTQIASIFSRWPGILFRGCWSSF